MTVTVVDDDAEVGPWLSTLLSGRPHQVIGDPADPYLLRWFLIPRNPVMNIYRHRFCQSDPSVPHDHPWHFLSFVIRGRYKRAELHWMQHCDDDKNDFSRWSGRVHWVRIATGGPS